MDGAGRGGRGAGREERGESTAAAALCAFLPPFLRAHAALFIFSSHLLVGGGLVAHGDGPVQAGAARVEVHRSEKEMESWQAEKEGEEEASACGSYTRTHEEGGCAIAA